MRIPLVTTLLLLLLAGCGGSKEPAYFALAAQPKATTSPGSAPTLIELRRPGIAGYLDRPDIVKTVKDYRLQLDTSERWAEPLGDMVGRVLAQNLATRLGESQIFVESGAIASIPEAIVAVDIQTFDAGADGDVQLIAQVVIDTAGGVKAARAKRFTLHAKPDGTNTAALVASMSALVGQLADGIAAMLREPR